MTCLSLLGSVFNMVGPDVIIIASLLVLGFIVGSNLVKKLRASPRAVDLKTKRRQYLQARLSGGDHPHGMMKLENKKLQYLQDLRTGTAYPIYRGIIAVIAILGYCVAALVALGAVALGLTMLNQSQNSVGRGLLPSPPTPEGPNIAAIAIIIGGWFVAGLIALGAKFWHEAATMLADLADSTTEANTRTRPE